MAKEAYSYTSIPEEQIDHALPSQERRRVQCRLTGKTKKTKKKQNSHNSAPWYICSTQNPQSVLLRMSAQTHILKITLYSVFTW